MRLTFDRSNWPSLLPIVCVLAVVALPVRGDVIFSPGLPRCGGSTPGGAGGDIGTQALSAVDGVQSFEIAGTCSALFSSSDVGSGSQPAVDFDLPQQDVYVYASGTSGGTDSFQTDSIHMIWSFTPESDLFGDINWTIWVEINGLPQIFSGTTEPGVEVYGFADLSVPQGDILTSWTAGLGIEEDGIASSDSNLSFEVPPSTFEIPESTLATPEPTPAASVLIIALLLCLGKRPGRALTCLRRYRMR
jgi:hypothetical protein